jgi:hypothetical protein
VFGLVWLRRNQEPLEQQSWRNRIPQKLIGRRLLDRQNSKAEEPIPDGDPGTALEGCSTVRQLSKAVVLSFSSLQEKLGNILDFLLFAFYFLLS